MTAKEFAEFLSLVMTAPTILLAVFVVISYAPTAWSAIKNLYRRWVLISTGHSDEAEKETHPLRSQDMLVTGIAIGFIGAAFDNSYWAIAWGASFLDLPSKDFWFSNGVYANIPFRQLAGIVAAIFHLMPVIDYRFKGNRYLNLVAYVTLLSGALLITQKLFFV